VTGAIAAADKRDGAIADLIERAREIQDQTADDGDGRIDEWQSSEWEETVRKAAAELAAKDKALKAADALLAALIASPVKPLQLSVAMDAYRAARGAK